jgi:hypothetical protein
VALISAAALAYEILLMRLFSIIQWHHFAYMIISLALLGYGAGGALVTAAQGAVERHFAPLFSAAAAAFGIGAIGCVVLAQSLPFNPLEILWDPRQPAYLLAVYLLLALPFLCAGACVCMTFSRWRGMPSRIYSFDILGAGAGSLGVVALLFALSPQDALKVIGALGWAAAAVAWLECGGPRRWPAVLLIALGVLPLLLPQAWIATTMSPYKELSQTLRIPDARVVEERFSPLGLVSVVESPRFPLRHAPGLSLNASVEPPPQLGVFIDGEGRVPDPIRRAARKSGPSRSDDIGIALSLAAAASRAGAGRRGWGGRAAGALSRCCANRCGGAESPGRRARTAPLCRLCGRHLFGRPCFGLGAGACRRGARFRRRQRAALPPHPGGAARFVQRLLGRPGRVVGELSLHGRGPAGRDAAP